MEETGARALSLPENPHTQHSQPIQHRLVYDIDEQAPPPGTLGTVLGVDDIGSLMMAWDNGSGLNVIWQVDTVRKL